MQVTKKELPQSEIELIIELSSEELGQYRLELIKDISQSQKFAGFRKGHVPEQVIVEKYGETGLKSEYLDIAVRESFIKAATKEAYQVLATPKISIESSEAFKFKAVFPVMPEVTIQPLSAITIPKQKTIKVSDQELAATKKKLQEQFASLNKLDKPAKKDNLVEIDFAGFDQKGASLPGTESKHHPVQIGSKTMIPGFEEELVGLKAGEEKEFTLTFPKDYHNQSFQGKKVTFKVKVHDVFEKKVPKFDEDLIKKLTGQEKSAPEMEAEIKEMLQEKYQEEERRRREGEFLTNLAKEAKIELPEVLIEEEQDRLVEEHKNELSRSRVSWEDHLAKLNKTEVEIRSDLKPIAIDRTKKRLALIKLLEQEKIEITEKEVLAEVDRVIVNYPQDQQREARQYFQKGKEGWNQLIHRLKINQLFEQLFGDNKTK
jgi:trigger factor